MKLAVFFTLLLISSNLVQAQAPKMGKPVVSKLDSPRGFAPHPAGGFVVWNEEGQSFWHTSSGESISLVGFPNEGILDLIPFREGHWLMMTQSNAGLGLYTVILKFGNEQVPTETIPPLEREPEIEIPTGQEIDPDPEIEIELAPELETPPSNPEHWHWVLEETLWTAPLEVRVTARLLLGPGEALYMALSDGGIPESAQDIDSILGKIWSFSMASDFKGPLEPKLFALGFRKPMALAWWKEKRFYGLDLGPDPTRGRGMDELNVLEEGKKYGWPLIWGNQSRRGQVTPFIQSTLARSWDPTQALVVKGGKWDGHLLYTGGNSKTLYRFIMDNRNAQRIQFQDEQLSNRYGPLKGILQDAKGQIWLLTEGNQKGEGQILPLNP